MYKIIGAIFLAWVIVWPCQAEDDSKEQVATDRQINEYVLVTAATIKEAAKDVSGSFSLVTQETIRRWKPVNLNDVLNLAGCELALVGGSYGQFSSTFIRGASSGQTLFMVNNVKINDPSSLSLDVSGLSPQVFGQIEIIDGPQSSLYGSEAMGGVVNMIPRSQKGLQADFWGGSSTTYAGNFSLAEKINKALTASISANLFSTNGMAENADYKSQNIYGDLTLSLNRLNIKPFVYLVQAKGGIPYNNGAPAPNRRTDTTLLVGGLPFQYDFSDRLHSDLTLGYSNHDYTLQDPQDPWGKYYHTGSHSLQLTERLVYQGINANSPTILGGEINLANVTQEDDYGKSFDGETYNASSLWLEQIVKFNEFTVIGALRADKYNHFAWTVSPRLSINWGTMIGQTYAGVYGLVSRGFRAPKPVEYASLWGNPNLNPEKSINFEGGVRIATASVSVNAGYFQTQFQDLIVYDMQTSKMANSDRDTVSGIQVQPMLHIGAHSLSISFMKLSATNDASGEALIRRPDYMLKINFHAAINRLNCDIFGQIVGKRKDYDDLRYLIVDNSGYSVFSICLNYTLHDNLNLFIKMQNAFNQRYQEIFGYVAPGRSVYVGFDFSL